MAEVFNSILYDFTPPLPEVELTTTITNGATFTDEESEALSAMVATGNPAVVKCTIADVPNMTLVMQNYAKMGFISTFGNANVMLVLIEGAWTAMLAEVQTDALENIENRIEDIERDHSDNTEFVNYMTALADNTENEGKFLQVVDGMWQAVALRDVSKEGL